MKLKTLHVAARKYFTRHCNNAFSMVGDIANPILEGSKSKLWFVHS
jgi:hypothetical protein